MKISAQLEVGGLYCSLQTPAEKFPAGRAEISHFGISIINAGGGVHHTGSPPTVGKSKGVTEFVKSRFYQPLQKELLIFLVAVKLGAKPMERDDCTSAFHLGGAKNVFEDGDKEIYLGHSQDPPGVRRAATVQSLQNAFAAVLFPFRILSVTWIFHGFTHQARYLTAILHTNGQMLEDARRYRAKWVDDHAWWVIRENAHTFFYYSSRLRPYFCILL